MAVIRVDLGEPTLKSRAWMQAIGGAQEEVTLRSSLPKLASWPIAFLHRFRHWLAQHRLKTSFQPLGHG